MIRPATHDDEPALRAIDRASWSPRHSPVPKPPPERPFDVAGVLVAERDEAIAGYIKIAPLWEEVEAARHVYQVKAITVAPEQRRHGVARELIEAAAKEAAAHGARRLTLRVLGHNAEARALYAACGFEVEGVLRELFWLEGRYVDDVLMTLSLTGAGPPGST